MSDRKTYLIAAAAAAAAFIIYLFTMAPSVVQIDAGELATVQLTAGIAHPTGYPLFAMLGYLFGVIPLGLRPIYQMNVLAGLYCAGALFFIILTFRMALSNFSVFTNVKKTVQGARKKQKRKEEKQASPMPEQTAYSFTAVITAAAAGGLSLAFNKTFWFQSTSVEVYSLHVFLMSVILWTLFRAWIGTISRPADALKLWLFVAGALALGFSNHMTTLLILPGVAYVFFTVNGFRKNSFLLAGKMLALFFLMLAAMYAYMPLRASANPALNWGNPVDMERLLRHVSGRQYQVWMFVSTEAAAKQLNYFFSNILSEYTLAFLPIAAGAAFFFARARKLFVFVFGTAVLSLLYAVNYDIVDIDSYFLLVYIALSFFAAGGALWWLTTESAGDPPRAVRVAVLAALIAIQAVIVFPKVNQRDTLIYEDYTRAILERVENDAIVFSYQWDYFISASYYLQNVENMRPDVAIIDKELLRRSWYFHQLRRNHASALAGVSDDIEMFLKGLQKFERDEEYDDNYLETYYRRIMTGLIQTTVASRPFYIGAELVEGEMQRGELTLPEGYRLVPELFLFRVVNDTLYHPAPVDIPVLRFPAVRDKYTENIYMLSAGMLARRAMYEMEYRYPERAMFYVKKLRAEFPDYMLPDALLPLLKINK